MMEVTQMTQVRHGEIKKSSVFTKLNVLGKNVSNMKCLVNYSEEKGFMMYICSCFIDVSFTLYTVRSLTDDVIAYIALCDKIFYHFTLFDSTLRHRELCYSVFSHICTANSAKTA